MQFVHVAFWQASMYAHPGAPFVQQTAFATHGPPHGFWPVGQPVQVPLAHFCPGAHVLLQPPRVFGSVFTVMHLGPNFLRGALHRGFLAYATGPAPRPKTTARPSPCPERQVTSDREKESKRSWSLDLPPRDAIGPFAFGRRREADRPPAKTRLRPKTRRALHPDG